MTAQLIPISGLGRKGPACFVVEADGVRLMLDLGYGPQPGVWPDVSNVGRVDALLLSHVHRDHAGALELLPKLGNPPVYASDITRRHLPAGIASRTLPLQDETGVCGMRVTTGRNGHAPGGVWLHMQIGGGLLYTGDFSVESPVYAYDPPGAADTLILDGSYGDYDAALTDSLPAFERIFDAGPVLMPVPPLGRAPEIALQVMRSGRPLPHLDSAVRSALADLSGPSRASVRPDIATLMATIARDAPPIDGAQGVMLAAAADAASGSAAELVSRWEGESAPAIVFTGYVPPGTPAARLTQCARARYMRWNAHPRLSDAAHLVRDTKARTVLPAFGDGRHVHAWQRAFGPARVVLEGPVAL
jgi:Cft2 family RNA processing exonuclease